MSQSHESCKTSFSFYRRFFQLKSNRIKTLKKELNKGRTAIRNSHGREHHSTKWNAGGLNFRVRNENGCTPTPKAPTLKIFYTFLSHMILFVGFHTFLTLNTYVSMYNVPYRKLRPISTPQLNTLLYLHLVPINLIISQGT